MAGSVRLDGVATRVSSPRFIGRETELARLEGLFKAAASEDRAATVLVGGEAGVGKSRFVSELAARVRDEGGLCVTGSCLELVDAALPFGAIVQMLRSLHRELDPATMAAVAGPAEEALAALLPELHAASDAAGAPITLFEQLLGLFGRLGDRVPTLLVLEDLHWADRSTRDLLVFLARNLRDERILLVGTYRSDDLHRRHPLRATLAELERAAVAERIELERFDHDEMRQMLGAILDREPETELLERTFRRSEGNAFFAEELLAAGDACDNALPESLRDIILARVDTLPEDVQQSLRVIAVIGRRADHRLVAALSDIPERELLDGLREAVAQQVLLTDADGLTYQFRHALVHEAVYDDLLPGERVRLHARFAELLAANPELFEGGEAALAGELACHWSAAHDNRRALPAALEAARAAERMYAYPEALAHAERALALWEQVADAEAIAGMRHVDVVRFAASQAELGGFEDRALHFIRAAADEVDPIEDPVTAGLVHERWGRYLWMLSAPTDEVLAHCEEAVRLVPPDAGTPRARVLATHGQQLMLARRDSVAIEVCREAIALAQQLGDRVIEGHARNSLGSSLADQGEIDDGLEQLHLAYQIALDTRSWGDAVRAVINEGGALAGVGRHEEALAISIRGAELARAHGLDRAYGAPVRLHICESLFLQGRWDEYEEQMREVDAIDPTGNSASNALGAWAVLLAARGEIKEANAYLARMTEALDARAAGDDRLVLADIELQILVESGDADAAVARVQRVIEADLGSVTSCDTDIILFLNGLDAAADAAVRARERHDAEREQVLRFAADELFEIFRLQVSAYRRAAARPAWIGAFRHQGELEAARASGADDASGWASLASEWDALGVPPRVAYAHWREGEALLAAGDRPAATVALRAAYGTARELPWARVRDRVAELARRARIDLGKAASAAASPAEQLGLTAREQEVLALVAEGRTNRQIAEVLFISTKTASVHVSNILAKLHVSNRAEAGATARRLGLDRLPR